MKASAITATLSMPLLWFSVAASQAPMTPREILARSVQAHGGESLTRWDTMTVEGTVDMVDRIVFRAAYRLFAKAPGKLRVEKDMTVSQGGRIFNEYFLNGGVAWSRRNLVPGRGNLEEMKSWFNQCFGIAYYATKAETLTRKEDGIVEWRDKAELQSNNYAVVSSRPAFVIEAVVDGKASLLYIDRENYYFLQEAAGRLKRVFWEFKKFGPVTMPTRILEITSGGRGEQFTPYVIKSVAYNVPIEDWLFTEDMPPSPVKK
jgi:hypothetical protein